MDKKPDAGSMQTTAFWLERAQAAMRCKNYTLVRNILDDLVSSLSEELEAQNVGP